jgi:hypothetical protein
MDGAERALLEAAVGSALARARTGADADAVLAELGWLEVLDAEPRDAVALVFDALGSTIAPATALDDVVASAVGVQPRADLAVLLPQFGAWEPPGALVDGHVRAAGLATARVTTASDILVVCNAASDTRAVTIAASSIDAHPVRGIDPDAGFHAVRVELRPVGNATAADAMWESAVALGRRAVAHQILGATRTMLGHARTHASERNQFGRPVGGFQAVRHRLAEALVAVESLEATLGAAGDEPNALTAALAKATAGRTARTVAMHCQQVLAGIGFTTDHPFHRLLKRTMLLEGLFGSADGIAVDLGRQLLASRRVPTLIEL